MFRNVINFDGRRKRPRSGFSFSKRRWPPDGGRRIYNRRYALFLLKGTVLQIPLESPFELMIAFQFANGINGGRGAAAPECVIL